MRQIFRPPILQHKRPVAIALSVCRVMYCRQTVQDRLIVCILVEQECWDDISIGKSPKLPLQITVKRQQLEQHFVVIGVVKSEQLQMHQNNLWIRIKVCFDSAWVCESFRQQDSGRNVQPWRSKMDVF